MLHLTLRQLSIFEAVARNLNYSRAADELHLSQPAVSMQIKQLEENIGIALFEQVGKKIHLTEAGHTLFAHSRAVTEQINLAEDSLANLKGLKRGRLNIAVVSTAKYFVPRMLSRFLESHPEAELRLNVSNREEVLQELANYETDFAIMGRVPQEIDADAERFAKNPYYFVAAPGHALAKRRRLTLEHLAGQSFLVREQGSGTRITLERLFESRHLKLKAAFEMGSNETIKQGVIAGLGISFLSRHTVGLELQTRQLVILPVAGTPIVRDWYLVHRKDKQLSPMAAAFRQFLLKEAGAMLDRDIAAR
jgi:DNA-binding transcriptional LysR family regulator